MRGVQAKISKRSFFFSAILHGAIIGLVVCGGIFFHEVKFGGSGDGIVSVWVSDPSGAVISGEKIATQAQAKKEMALGKKKKASEEKDAGSAEKSGVGGRGEGIGTGTGAGVGLGKDGDPALATIWKKINNAKYYPLVAKQRGAEGLPRVTFTVNTDGSVSNLKLAASCGNEILDSAALETVRRAAPLPFYPAPITVTVQYTLKK